MAKRKYPSELNTRTIRVNIGDWQWLNSLSQRLGITVAQAFHKVITDQDRDQDRKAPVERTQIPMPVTIAKSTPVTRARSTPITVSFSREVEHTNGHK